MENSKKDTNAIDTSSKKALKRTLGKYPNIGLINYEGDVIKAYKIKEKEFILIDCHGELIDLYSYTKLVDFLNGETTITISSGEVYNFLEQHQNARPKPQVLTDFLEITKIPTKKYDENDLKFAFMRGNYLGTSGIENDEELEQDFLEFKKNISKYRNNINTDADYHKQFLKNYNK
jgi:hypothetical protein